PGDADRRRRRQAEAEGVRAAGDAGDRQRGAYALVHAALGGAVERLERGRRQADGEAALVDVLEQRGQPLRQAVGGARQQVEVGEQGLLDALAAVALLDHLRDEGARELDRQSVV